MRTYSRMRSDGSIESFDISNSFWWSLGPMRRLLESVDGVENVRRNWFNQNRYSFSFYGRQCVVNETWGDSDRYCISPVEMEPPLDLTAVHEVFRRYRVPYTGDPDFNEEHFAARFGKGLSPDVSAVDRYRSAQVDMIVWIIVLFLSASATDEVLRALLSTPARHGPVDELPPKFRLPGGGV